MLFIKSAVREQWHPFMQDQEGPPVQESAPSLQFCEGTVMTCTYTVGAGSGQDVSPLDVTSVNTTLCSAGWTQQSIAGLNTTASVHTRVYSSASIHKAGKNYICFSTGIGVGGTPFKVFRQIDTGSPDKEEMIGPDSPIISIYSKSTWLNVKCCLKNLKRMEDIFSLHPNECCAETAELNLKFRNQAVKESGVYTVLIESFVMKI